MREWAVPFSIAVQALLLSLLGAWEQPPPAPDLGAFPDAVDQWVRTGDTPLEPAAARQLGVDQWLGRNYINRKTGVGVQLFVGWFQSQRGGATQPHSPKVCLPGSGWIPQETAQIMIETRRGIIPANRYIVTNAGQRAAVIYWYQTPRRVLAGEWESKLWLIPDALRDRRTDTALVRVLVWRADGAGMEGALDFARAAYPLLRDALPR